MFNIAVGIRQVPSTETRIVVNSRTNQVDLGAVDWVIGPYDEFALEEALRLRERHGGTVTVISLGPERVRSALRTALATGADAAIHILSGDTAPDPVLTAQALAEIIRQSDYHLALFGYKGVDDDMGYVGVAVAELLDWPHVASVIRLELAADLKSAVVQREIEGMTEHIRVTLPAALTTQKGLNEPRYPSLRGMMLAGKKEIAVHSLSELGLEPGNELPGIKVLDARLPPERPGGRLIVDPPNEAVQELVRALREEARVI